ncbi:MAG: hypothetical protein CTR53_12705 [Ferrovibrio sp.]|nr:MAG: hypothetical protein CTR53_12705 [Ferrovibrio sp.]
MLKAASEAYFSEFPFSSLQKRVNQAIKASEQFSTRRNEIAHGIVAKNYNKPNDLAVEGEKSDDYWNLVPAMTSTKKVKLNSWGGDFTPEYAFTAKEINDFASGFWSLANDVALLIQEVRQRRCEYEELSG